MRICANTVLVLLLISVAVGYENVTVIRKRLTFEEVHVLVVDTSVEYILEFVPIGDQGTWPTRVWMRTDGGDTAHPVLIIARRTIGSTIWQLPYALDSTLLYQQERTLCPEDSVDVEALQEDCESSQPIARGTLFVHVTASCAVPASLSLRVSPDRDWRLPFDSPTPVHTTEGAPRVYYYQFQPEQTSVRLVVESEDDVCATIAIQNYTVRVLQSYRK